MVPRASRTLKGRRRVSQTQPVRGLKGLSHFQFYRSGAWMSKVGEQVDRRFDTRVLDFLPGPLSCSDDPFRDPRPWRTGSSGLKVCFLPPLCSFTLFPFLRPGFDWGRKKKDLS